MISMNSLFLTPKTVSLQNSRILYIVKNINKAGFSFVGTIYCIKIVLAKCKAYSEHERIFRNLKIW